MNNLVRSLEFWMNDWNFEAPSQYYSMKRSRFKEKSLRHWAAKEIIEEVKRHPEENPINVLDRFQERMFNFCCMAKTEEANYIFGILFDTTTNAIDYLQALSSF